MTKCDFKQLCTRFKDQDRITGWSVTIPDEMVNGELHINVIQPAVSGRLLRDLKAGGWTVKPIVEPGKDVATYRTCDKRSGHPGNHGYYWYQHPTWYARKLRIRLSNIVLPGGIS